MEIGGELGPMSEAELEQLDLMLSGPEAADGMMSLEMLDGFLSALVVGPELVMPSEYLPYVWGDGAEGQNMAPGPEAYSAVLRLWNHIAWRVQQPIEDDDEGHALLMPALALPEGDTPADDEDPLTGVPDDFPFAAGWANGFLLGVSLRAEAWEGMVQGDEDLGDDMDMVLSLSVVDAAHAEEMELPPEAVMDLQERVSTAMELPDMLHDMNLRRLQGRVTRVPLRREPVPGRNEECSCGSGKKYKKCCGAGGSLH